MTRFKIKFIFMMISSGRDSFRGGLGIKNKTLKSKFQVPCEKKKSRTLKQLT